MRSNHQSHSIGNCGNRLSFYRRTPLRPSHHLSMFQLVAWRIQALVDKANLTSPRAVLSQLSNFQVLVLDRRQPTLPCLALPKRASARLLPRNPSGPDTNLKPLDKYNDIVCSRESSSPISEPLQRRSGIPVWFSYVPRGLLSTYFSGPTRPLTLPFWQRLHPCLRSWSDRLLNELFRVVAVVRCTVDEGSAVGRQSNSPS